MLLVEMAAIGWLRVLSLNLLRQTGSRNFQTGHRGPIGFSLDVPVTVIYGDETASFKLGCTYDATAKFTASLGIGFVRSLRKYFVDRDVLAQKDKPF